MTDLATALAIRPLTPFEDRDVLRTSISVTNAGDGLSEAMAIDPQELHHGERVYLVIEATVSKVRYDPISGTDCLTRVHVLKAGNATIVDKDLVKDHLDKQAERIRIAKEKAQGITPLFGAEETEDEQEARLLREHDEGQHADALADYCAQCDAERDAEEAENE